MMDEDELTDFWSTLEPPKVEPSYASLSKSLIDEGGGDVEDFYLPSYRRLLRVTGSGCRTSL